MVLNYDSPFNPFGIDREEPDYSSYSLEELRSEEKRISDMLREQQTNEPNRKRKNKIKYDSWVRGIAYHVNELRCVRDEIAKRTEV